MKKKEFKILLVDDKHANLIALEEMLADENRIFLKALSGNEALKLTLKNDDIGLVMLDVQMPEMDGFEVARLLNANPKTKDIPIIFVTAISKEEHFVLKGFKEGAVDYLQKPLNVNVTKAKVKVFEKLHFYQQSLRNAILEKDAVNKRLEKFQYIVAHDLKSPLAGIMSLVSLLKEDNRLKQYDDLSDCLVLLGDATDRSSNLISAILDYSISSVDNHREEEVDVNKLVSEITYFLFPPNNIKIKTETVLPTISTNKYKLLQVLQNLISNAIKYNDKKEGMITIGASEGGKSWEFWVKDNGPGIDKKEYDNIFKLFKTGSNKSKLESSTGVGLNVVKTLVEEQGGKIRVDSIYGEGSTFSFQWKNS